MKDMRRYKRRKWRGILLSLALCSAVGVVAGDSAVAYAGERFLTWQGGFGAGFLQNGPHEMRGPGAMEGTGFAADTGNSAEVVNTGEEYSFDEGIYPYYALLDDEQKAVYHQVYANAVVQNASFALAQPLAESSLSDAVCAVYNDHPELFWLETAYSYSYDRSGRAVSVTLSYYLTGEQLEQAQSSFDAAVGQIVAGAEAYGTQIEQELYVHDAINELTGYDTNAQMNQSAYSALVGGSTVCAGYARAFQYVLQQLDYVVYYCTGTADGGDHAWNIIELEDEFYNVDLTWDDSISEAYGSKVYTYFNLTDEEISVDHTRSELSSKLPACTGTALAYTAVYGDTLSIDDIEVESGTHSEGDMIITPSVPEVTDWRELPQGGNGTGFRMPGENGAMTGEPGENGVMLLEPEPSAAAPSAPGQNMPGQGAPGQAMTGQGTTGQGVFGQSAFGQSGRQGGTGQRMR